MLWREEQEIARSQKVEQREQELLNAFIDLRDSVLFERGPLAEAGLSSDQVNAVLGVIDDAFPASELRAALRVYPHVVEGIKCCDVYVGDFHIKGFLGTDKDSVRASAEEFCARLRAALNPEEKP